MFCSLNFGTHSIVIVNNLAVIYCDLFVVVISAVVLGHGGRLVAVLACSPSPIANSYGIRDLRIDVRG